MRYLLFSFLLLTGTFLNAQIDYVELVVPDALKDNPEAVFYLQKDVAQLNKLFHSLDAMATDFEDIAVMISKVDTTDTAAIEAIKPAVVSKIESLSMNYLSFSMNLFWYFGKDVLASEEATKDILKKLDTADGIVYQKQMDHIKLKRGLLEKRAKEFITNLEAIDLGE